MRWTLGGVVSASPTPLLKVLADTVPNKMPPPIVVEVNPYDVTVKWDDLVKNADNGRDLPIFYLL